MNGMNTPPPTILTKLLEKWMDLYDRSLLYFYTFFSAIAAVLGKDLILGDKSAEVVFKIETPGSYYLVGTTLLFASFLAWYNYVSVMLFETNMIIIETDPLYRQYILKRSRIWENIAYLVVTHAVLFLLPFAVLCYYNYQLGFGWHFSIFGLFTRLATVICVGVGALRLRSLIYILGAVRNRQHSDSTSNAGGMLKM